MRAWDEVWNLGISVVIFTQNEYSLALLNFTGFCFRDFNLFVRSSLSKKRDNKGLVLLINLNLKSEKVTLCCLSRSLRTRCVANKVKMQTIQKLYTPAATPICNRIPVKKNILAWKRNGFILPVMKILLLKLAAGPVLDIFQGVGGRVRTV